MKELRLPPCNVKSFYVDHTLQQLLVTVTSQEVYEAAIGCLHEGVPWPLAGGALTHPGPPLSP
jgi:hypothetical protein